MSRYMVFDIGGTSIKYGCADENAAFLAKGMLKPVPATLEGLVEAMAAQCESLCPGGVDGVALSSPGAVDPQTGLVAGISMVPAIHQGSVKQALGKRLGVPVSVENDANCAALGEVWKGAAQGVSDALFVVIGSGIGGAVIRDGRLVRGAGLQAGEFGYMLLDPQNLAATWSALASVRGMAEYACRKKGAPLGALDGKTVFQKAREGDAECRDAVEYFYHNLAVGIYNLLYLFDPQVVFLGGAVSGRPELVREVDRRVQQIFAQKEVAPLKAKLRACRFQGDANLVGALRCLLLRDGQ